MSQPVAEEKAQGRISMKTYYKYFTTEGGHLLTLLVLVVFIFAEVLILCELLLCYCVCICSAMLSFVTGFYQIGKIECIYANQFPW